MKINKIIILSLGIIALFSTSCKKKGCTNSTATNYNEKAKKDDGSCIYPIIEKNDSTDTKKDYTTPLTYVFNDANGNNTVSFGGQTQRLDMLSEMVTYMKISNTAGVSISTQTLKDMYANNGYSWTDANNLGLTGSSKQLKSKTAGNDAGIQSIFEGYMTQLGTLSASTISGQENGADGVDGIWANDGVKGPYLMSGNGHEYTQLIEKGLMGAIFINQLTINYLGNISTDDNTTIVDASAGKHYTEMEHHWDEAYGYFTSATDYPTTGTDRFWGKYASKRESALGSKTKIGNAFRKGRAAISNDDYTTRDEQITIINMELEKVAAGTAIHYLKGAKTNIANATARNHSLSEAIAFLDGLRYSYNAQSGGINAAQIDGILATIGTNFNQVTLTSLQTAIDDLATKTGLTNNVNDL